MGLAACRLHRRFAGASHRGRLAQSLPRSLEDRQVITGFLARESPRLPAHGTATSVVQLAAAGLIHVIVASIIVVLMRPLSLSPPDDVAQQSPHAIATPLRLVFFAPTAISGKGGGGGGGGGGNQQAGPIRRGQGLGTDAFTLKTAHQLPAIVERLEESGSELPVALLLSARPLASGSFDQIGLPNAGVAFGTSTGPGSGGGVGTGTGTGIGPGQGPGLGPGSGGGAGGGVYRPGGAVTKPRLLSEVKPTYTNDALSAKIQGSVWLEVVVTTEGRAANIRVLRSLDPDGLDEQAIAAVRQWRFEPGRLAGDAVNVTVIVVLDFQIR